MDDDLKREILSEVRKIRRSNYLATYVYFLLLAFCGYVFWSVRVARERAADRDNFMRAVEKPDLQAPSAPHKEPEEYGWRSIESALDRGDTKKALSMATNWIGRSAHDYYAYAWLGRVYLAAGELTNAEIAYQRAYDLFPDEDNGKPLAAVRKRLANENKPVAK